MRNSRRSPAADRLRNKGFDPHVMAAWIVEPGVSLMIKRLRVLGAALLIAAELAGCTGAPITSCDEPAYQSVGACAVGRHKDGS